MSKRLTDTEKWRDDWFGSLCNDYRIVWQYLVDSCNHAGIWKKDFRGLNFNCNTNLTESDIKEIFNGRLIDRGNFFFIPKFLKFQYPGGLNSHKPVIVSVVKELQLNNLIDIVKQSLGNDYLIIKSKDKDKSKDKEKDKSIEKEKGVTGEKDFKHGIIAQRVLEYYVEVTGRKIQVKNQLHLRRVNARIKEGHTEAGLREIIEIKSAEWVGTNMEKYLHPDTLFSQEKCNKYRDQVQHAKDNKLTLNQIKGKRNDKSDLWERVAATYKQPA
jgi:uncharacterized phage protein (TIGR02220 family)